MDIFNTQVLRKHVESLMTPASFLLDRFFPAVQADGDEKISFDQTDKKPRITPFVSPLVAGKVVDSRGYATKTFEPAYAKDKRRFLPNAPLRRTAGEAIGGSLTPSQRRAVRLRQEIDDQLEMLTLREEVMASEALRTGRVTVQGDGFDTKVVDYGRDPSLSVVNVGADRWSESTATPLDDIEDWAGLMAEASGAVARSLVMDPKSWSAIRKRDDVKELFETRRGSSSQGEIGPLAAEKARLVGYLGDFAVWVYQQTYVDNDGVTQKMLPDGTVIMATSEMEGTRAYGAIQDEEAGYDANRFFTKSWLEKDPAVRWLLLQSAPLVVPYRVNASLAARVFG